MDIIHGNDGAVFDSWDGPISKINSNRDVVFFFNELILDLLFFHEKVKEINNYC